MRRQASLSSARSRLMEVARMKCMKSARSANGAKSTKKLTRRGGWPWLGAAAVFCLLAARGAEAMQCDLPPAFQLRLEQRATGDDAGSNVVEAPAAGAASVLFVGDRIVQANGRRVRNCADLESAAGEALAKGLVLLLGVERDGKLVSVAAEIAPEDAGEAAPARAGEPAATKVDTAVGVALLATGVAIEVAFIALEVATDRNSIPRTPLLDAAVNKLAGVEAYRPGVEIAAAPAEETRPAAVELPAAAVELSPAADAGPGLRRSAADAAAALRDLDGYARVELPARVYERNLDTTEGRIEALSLGSDDGSAAVRSAVDAILGYHRTARDICRAKIEFLNKRERDVRAAGYSIPYHSDSEVPRWLARYPFLRDSLRASPSDWGNFGERSGYWDPDRALELLWEHARADTAKLAAWASATTE